MSLGGKTLNLYLRYLGHCPDHQREGNIVFVHLHQKSVLGKHRW